MWDQLNRNIQLKTDKRAPAYLIVGLVLLAGSFGISLIPSGQMSRKTVAGPAKRSTSDGDHPDAMCHMIPTCADNDP